jgi:hypothetical protein
MCKIRSLFIDLSGIFLIIISYAIINKQLIQNICFIFLSRYFLRVTIVKRLSDYVKEQDIVVHTLSQYPEMNSSIKMEVGIEDCLHIEFEYNKSK